MFKLEVRDDFTLSKDGKRYVYSLRNIDGQIVNLILACKLLDKEVNETVEIINGYDSHMSISNGEVLFVEESEAEDFKELLEAGYESLCR